MDRPLVRIRLVLAGLLAALPLLGLAETPGAALSPDEIVRKAVERAESPVTRELRPNYLFTRHNVTEELDPAGHVKARREKLWEVSVEAGLPYKKLLQLNGQDLSAADSKKQGEREAADRPKIFSGKEVRRVSEADNYLTPEMAGKYNFSLVDEKPVNGRMAYLLDFEPKSGLPVSKATDRIANLAAGRVWIDTEDFEIARVEIHLKSEVALWGGMIGTLRHCRYTLERMRLPDGVWFDTISHGIAEGRKLLEPFLIRERTESSNFRRVEIVVQ
jgi:hypothetical protein